MRPLTPCLVCGRPCAGPRCSEHGGSNSQTRPRSSTAQGYGADWRRVRDRAIAAHLAKHGPVCPGWRKDPHPVSPDELSADHIVPISRGGARLDPANIAVLCVPCNSAKRDTLDGETNARRGRRDPRPPKSVRG